MPLWPETVKNNFKNPLMSDSNIKVKVKSLQNNVKYIQDDTANPYLKASLAHTS